MKKLNSNNNNNILIIKKKSQIPTIKLNLIISPHEYLLPIILYKNKYIIFSINGKYKIQNNFYDKENCNLLGRLSNEKIYFKIFDGLKLTTNENKTFLFIKFDFDKYSKYEIEGNCELILFYCTEENIYNIYNEIGINLNINMKNREIFINILNFIRKETKKFINIFCPEILSENNNINNLINNNIINKLEFCDFLFEICEYRIDDLIKHNKFSINDSLNCSLKEICKDKFIKIKNNLRSISKLKEDFNDIKESLTFLYCSSKLDLNNFYLNVFKNIFIDELIPSKKNRKLLLNKNFNYFGYCIKLSKNFGYLINIIYSEKYYK